jgi:hypothetical protein
MDKYRTGEAFLPLLKLVFEVYFDLDWRKRVTLYSVKRYSTPVIYFDK